MAAASPGAIRAVAAILVDYRDRIAEVVDRAAPPHDLPSAREALETVGLGQTTGPKKPFLVRAFKPMGYDCRGESGMFTLRRRTPGNLTVEIGQDVAELDRSFVPAIEVAAGPSPEWYRPES